MKIPELLKKEERDHLGDAIARLTRHSAFNAKDNPGVAKRLLESYRYDEIIEAFNRGLAKQMLEKLKK